MKGTETFGVRTMAKTGARTGTRKALTIIGLAVLLGGCELLPEHAMLGREAEETSAAVACHAGEPTFEDEACLLHNWVAFSLASQRGDREWRSQTMMELDAAPGRSEAERELARAVILAWGNEREWRQATELYREYTHAAPADLQPLLRYWRNELEGRRSLASQGSNARAQAVSLQQENAELAEKLEALTAIEQNMNLRQQSP
ncbi:hypothetical protein HOP51_12285 [Halomonas sp. MCCC 1A11036]|uniref:YfhG lipoprotein n=1 Tax=Billgrantia zhangzhouensis TaxID=2733481 RepID=A0ABS9AGP0_9GAMM|nr:hypothetical protein [Halomonas zhangzhouensis]MCE8020881.1 hypothetical protein [Halomonas zhangzhouensis]